MHILPIVSRIAPAVTMTALTTAIASLRSWATRVEKGGVWSWEQWDARVRDLDQQCTTIAMARESGVIDVVSVASLSRGNRPMQ